MDIHRNQKMNSYASKANARTDTSKQKEEGETRKSGINLMRFVVKYSDGKPQ